MSEKLDLDALDYQYKHSAPVVLELTARIRALESASNAGEAVAEIGAGWLLVYAGTDSLAAIVERTGAKIGDKLYTRAALVSAQTWTPVADGLPVLGQSVLATYLNQAGKPRRIRAKYISAKTVEAGTDDDTADEYDEATDTYWLQAGWYEQIDNWGDYSQVQVCEGEVTHWTPLPAAPNAPESKEGS